MFSNFSAALSRGIDQHVLYESQVQEDYIGDFFHEEDMDGAYDDDVTWQGIGVPQEHFPLQTVSYDGIQPSWTVRYLARSWTLGIVVPLEDKQDDLYGIIHKFFPMAGGEFARAYSLLKQLLGAQFFGLYGFQSGTSVPFSPDGLSFFNTAHPMSSSNLTQTWANRPSTDADLSESLAKMAISGLKTQKRPNGQGVLANKLRRVMVHPNEEIIARQIFESMNWEPRTTDRNDNRYVAGLNVDVCVNPYWEYSGTNGASAPNFSEQQFNSVVFQGDTHYCKWKNRSDLQYFDRFDNTVFADIITVMKRFCYGLTDARGLFGSKGS